MSETKQSLPTPGELLKKSFSLYFSHFKIFLGILVIPVALVFLIIVLGVVGQIVFWGTISGALLTIVIMFAAAVSLIAGGVSYLALFDAVIEGGQPQGGVRGAWIKAWHMFVPFAWIGILTMLCVLGGYVFFIIPGMIIGVWLSLAIFSLVAEGRHGLNALAASWHYVKGYWWAVFWRLCVSGIVAFIIASILNVFNPQNGIIHQSLVSSLIYLFLSLIFGFTVQPTLGVIYPYYIYQSLREVKSSYPIEEDAPKLKKEIIAFAAMGIIALVAMFALIIALFSNEVNKQRSSPTYDFPAISTSSLSATQNTTSSLR